MGRLNRIYVKNRDIAESMYRRQKERRFTTEDVMRLHWDRQGKGAKAWARERIKRMRVAGYIESFVPEGMPPDGDGRRVLYRFTEGILKEWNLHQ